jgi:hypothetical protein
MTEPRPFGPVLRRTWSAETSRLRVVPRSEERRRRRLRTRLTIDVDLDRRLRALGYRRKGG